MAECIVLTIDSQIAKRCTGGTLHFVVVRCEEIQHRVQCVPSDFPYFLFGDLCKGQSGGPLKVDVIGEGEGGQGGKG